jgi:hypothetical protein
MQHCIVIVLSSKAEFYLSISFISDNIIKERNKSTILYLVINCALNKGMY